VVVIVRVEVDVFGEVSVTGFGLKVPVAPVGKPVTERLTLPLKVFIGVRVKLYLALVPALMVSTLVFAAIEKSGMITTSETDVVCVRVPSVPETVMV